MRDQTHSAPIIQRGYSRFLDESSNPDDREYFDDDDQIHEVLIHEYYMSQRDITPYRSPSPHRSHTGHSPDTRRCVG